MDNRILFVYKMFILIEIFLFFLIVLKIKYYKIFQKIYRSLLFFIIAFVSIPLKEPNNIVFKIILNFIVMLLIVTKIEKNNFLLLKKIKLYRRNIWNGIKKK